jgi:predicted peptidase
MRGWRLLWLVVPLTLAGCPVPQPQDTPVDEWLAVEPVTGTGYYIYVPSGYTHEKPAPLVVTCHGTPPYDVARHHIKELKMLGERNGCIVVAPKLSATDGIFTDGPLVAVQADERRILSLVSHLGYRYNLDKANMMITGFSGGGYPTYWVGLRHPEVFSVVVARNCNFSQKHVDGWYPPGARRQAVKVYYGEHDVGRVVDQSHQAITYLRARGFQVDAEMLPGKGHERTPEVAMSFFREHWRPRRASLPAP